MKSIRFIWLLFFLSTYGSIDLCCQESELTIVDIQEERYIELRNDLDLDRTKKALRPKEKKKEKKEEKKKKPKSQNWKIPFLGSVFELFAYALILVLVIAILYFIFSNVEIEKHIDPSEIPEHIEDIEVIDSLSAFDKALAAGDYRTALRMRFLRALQILQKKDMIKWKPEKTNRDYSRELRGTVVSTQFSKMARIFEYVWYGNKEIDRVTFDDLDKDYQNFLKVYDV